MAAKEDKPVIYTIPENFIDESRIIKGMFKTRNFIEGVIMAGIVGIFAYLIPMESLTNKITMLVFVCGPLFILGIQGINGDPVSTTIRNARNWLKHKNAMIYNLNARPLSKSPLDAMMEEEQPKDKIIDKIDEIKEKRSAKNACKEMVEGVDFEFEDDEKFIFGRGEQKKEPKREKKKNKREPKKGGIPVSSLRPTVKKAPITDSKISIQPNKGEAALAALGEDNDIVKPAKIFANKMEPKSAVCEEKLDAPAIEIMEKGESTSDEKEWF